MKEILIPTEKTSSEPSEKLTQSVINKLAIAVKKGKGDFKIRTASGAFNSWITSKNTSK